MEMESNYSTVLSELPENVLTCKCDSNFNLVGNFLTSHKFFKRHDGDCLQVEEFDDLIFNFNFQENVVMVNNLNNSNNGKTKLIKKSQCQDNKTDFNDLNNEDKYSVILENNLELENGKLDEKINNEQTTGVLDQLIENSVENEIKEVEKKYKIISDEKSIIKFHNHTCKNLILNFNLLIFENF